MCMQHNIRPSFHNNSIELNPNTTSGEGTDLRLRLENMSACAMALLSAAACAEILPYD